MDRGPTINHQRLEMIRAIQRPDGSSLLERVIHLFEGESAALLIELEEAIERRQADQIRAAAHKFKSVSGNVGADALAACCMELELKGRDDRLDGSAEILEEIRSEHGKASAALRSEIDQSSGN